MSRPHPLSANLAGARNLTQRQLDASCGDAKTRLPAGLTTPTCSGRSRR